jgi:peptidoglycan/LPS O-acetylase OafA/YrhL
MRDKIFAPRCRIQLSAYPADLTREGDMRGRHANITLESAGVVLTRRELESPRPVCGSFKPQPRMLSQGSNGFAASRSVPGAPGKIASLDGLRAISIIMVLIGHASGAVAHPSRVLDFLAHTFGDGELGVSIFFVISGFLITTLLIKERERAGQIHLGNFYLRRIFRILPAFYLYLFALAVISCLGWIRVPRSAFIAAATFTWNYHFGNWNWFLGHLWSLSIEEQFYIAWPLLLFIGGKSFGKKLAVGIIGLSPLIRIATYTSFPRLRDYIPYMLHTRADILMYGCLAALFTGSRRFEQLLNRVFRMKLPLLGAIFLLFVSPNFYDRFGGNYILPIGLTLEGAAITLFVLWVVRRPSTAIGRVLNLSPICFLGAISYSLYLWQQLFLTGFNTSVTGRFPLNYALSIAAAIISYFAVERPFLSLRARLRFSATRM